MKVSVAMATYNGEKYLKQQIDSILFQLRDGDELVISDDHSKDGTVSIIEKYQQEDPRVKLYINEEKGVT
jgi:glycosyltransferase involved in cell wall biosynthesis